MSKNELQLRERFETTRGPMRESQKARSARVLRDDEMDAVSGGYRIEIGNLPCE